MLKMPVNSVTETKKGVDRPRFSLSLSKNNASYLSNENRKPSESCKESDPCKPSASSNKENKPLKRPSKSVYNNTLSAAKKLKPLNETSKPAEKQFEAELIIAELSPSAMLNGHHNTDNQYAGSVQRKTPIATLSNLGNTCFLNSVLYTLRYAPRFLHNLHHLVSDLASVEQKLGSIRLKSSSLGRSAAGLASSGARSWSSKDLLSLGQSDNNSGKSKIQIATEKLHETYLNLRAAESKCLSSSSADASPEPYAADAFLAALRDVNSTFEGNRQQDAHELLVCILDNIRETCRALGARARAARLQLHDNGDSNGVGRQPSVDGDTGKATLGNLRKSWKKRKEVKANDKRASPIDDRPPSPADSEKDERSRPGWDFVADDFEGTMVVRTMCLECEAVTEKAQAVCELCVPVSDEEPDAEPFRAACLSTEYLRDQNKYWCERCLRYNEARRSVAYSRLPRLLVLQLKRFSGGMEKITRHAPTPLLMPCFCEPCAKRPPEQPPTHRYILWAVIMHLGQTLTGGHYVAYAREPAPGTGPGPGTGPAPGPGHEQRCARDPAGAATNAPENNTNTASGGGFMRTLFSRPRPSPSGCLARECCVPRARPDAAWLACDDDLVKPISNEEFEDLLSAEPRMRSAATPYLLFYVKSDVG